jgi:hypothetical protein
LAADRSEAGIAEGGGDDPVRVAGVAQPDRFHLAAEAARSPASVIIGTPRRAVMPTIAAPGGAAAPAMARIIPVVAGGRPPGPRMRGAAEDMKGTFVPCDMEVSVSGPGRRRPGPEMASATRADAP